jgi:hypothetical protein
MRQCKAKNLRWAILSDLYGIWSPEIRHEWYEKDSDTVIGAEFSALLRDFDAKLIGYSEIYFYYNPARFHPIYALLLAQIKLADRVKRITHLWEIT